MWVYSLFFYYLTACDLFSAAVQLKTKEYETFVMSTYGFYHFYSLNLQKNTFNLTILCFFKLAKKTFDSLCICFIVLFLFFIEMFWSTMLVKLFLHWHFTFYVWKVQAVISEQRQVNKSTALRHRRHFWFTLIKYLWGTFHFLHPNIRFCFIFCK